MTHAVGRFNRTRAGAAASVAAAIALVAFVVPMPRATVKAAPVIELGGQPIQDPAPTPSVIPEPTPSPSPTPSPTPSAAQDPAPTPVVVPAGSGSEPTVRRFTIVSIPDPREPAPQGDTFGRGAYRLGLNWSLPVVLKRIMPVYTPEAATAGIEGTVLLDAVVGVDGRVADLRIARSLNKELGLDDAALEAARQWLFEPATRDGEPLPVIVRLELEFKLP